MNWREKKVPLSTPTKSSATPEGLDENGRRNQEMGLSVNNSNKETVKNLISPTGSAPSNATFSRRKILAERNVSPRSNSSSTPLSKTPNLDSKASPKIIPKASHKNSPNLDPKATSEKTPLSYSSRDETPSPRPYDPLTNYLSPRPQFLRYNPNRRNEIFLRLKMEDRADDELSASSTASFDSNQSASEADSVSSDGSLSEQEDEEFDIGGEEGWSLRGVLKYMLLLVVLLLTTSYISSMNSPIPSQAFEDLTLGSQKIYNHSYGTVESVEAGYKFLDGKQEQLGLLGLNHAIVDEGIKEEMVESVKLGEIVEEVKNDGKSEDACGEELIEGADDSDQFVQDDELQEKDTVEKLKDVQMADELKVNGESEDRIEDEFVERKEVSDHLVESIETEETGELIEDVEKVDRIKENEHVIEEELMETGEVSDKMVGQDTAGEIKTIQGDQASQTTDSWGKSYTLGSLNFAKANPLKGLYQDIGTEVLVKFMFGVLTVAAIVTSLVLGSNIRRKGIASKHSSVDKHSSRPVVKEEPSNVLSAQGEENKRHFDSCMINSMGKDIKEPYQSRAPSVELLAEFEVGAIKSCDIKCRMKDEVSSYSGFASKAYSAPVQDQQYLSDSNSSERLVVKKNNLRKEFANNDETRLDGEGRNAVTTPLRRSARIRNRAVASP